MASTRYLVCIQCIALLAWGCGSVEDAPFSPSTGGKADGVWGNSSNSRFAQGVESNLPVEIVTQLALALKQDWVEDHRSHWYSATVEDKELKKVFSASEDLIREFGDLQGDEGELQRVYQALREILHNGAAIRYFSDQLSQGKWRQVYAAYKEVRPELLSLLGEKSTDKPAPGELPTIVVNIPAERIQVFHEGRKLQDNQVVVGQPEYQGYSLNSKTRVGDHTIKEWHHCYSNAEYPPWCENKSKGAFGVWTAKLDRSYQYIHGTVGNKLIAWFAIKTAPGSHGCIRNQNSDIETIHDLCPVGTWVRKIYAVTERTASIEESEDDETQVDDLFDQDLEVKFWVKKHDNLYGYDVKHTPSALPEAHRIEERPNGVYYPETGVVVGYAHPTDAMISALSGSSGSRCAAQGGTCIAVDQCSGAPVPGLCPGDASIQCCIPQL